MLQKAIVKGKEEWKMFPKYFKKTFLFHDKFFFFARFDIVSLN